MNIRLIVVRLLLLGCVGLASYLWSVSLASGDVAGCGGALGCGSVLASKWSHWFSIPVSFLAILNYVSLLVLVTVPAQYLRPVLSVRAVWSVASVLALCTIGAGIWFLLLQLLKFKAICAYCMTAHALGAVAAAMVLREAASHLASLPDADRQNTFRWGAQLTRRILAIAAGTLLLLVGGQISGQRILYRLSRNPSDGNLYAVANSPEGRTITLRASGLQMVVKQWPVIGSAQADNFILSFYDYTCSHCRAMHPVLVETQRKFGVRLAIVSLLTPIDAECNRLVAQTSPEHENACHFARTALAIRMVDAAKFAQFDDWMFASPGVRSREEVDRYARGLVGEDRLAVALKSPQIARQINLAADAAEANYREFHREMLPQLMIGRAFVAGEVPDAERLVAIVQEHLKLSPP